MKKCKECGQVHQLPVYYTTCQSCGIKVSFKWAKEKSHVTLCKLCLEEKQDEEF